MLTEVEFIFDPQLISAVEKLIRDSKNQLLLISPYIDLDARIYDALNEKKQLPDFELKVLFGKNEGNYLKSIKRDSLGFLKEFPNVEIRYNERLHAKFYRNDFEYIMTSLNLYDFSLANNIEVGVRAVYAEKGLLGKAIDMTSGLIEQGIGKVKHDVLGVEKDIDPIQKFDAIFESSDLLYRTRPRNSDQSMLQSFFGKRKLDGFDIEVDNFNKIASPVKKPDSLPETVTTTITSTTQTIITESRCVSASQLAKSMGVQTKEITLLMQRKGLIYGDTITDAGRLRGLVMKNYMGNNYVAYPDNLPELTELGKKI